MSASLPAALSASEASVPCAVALNKYSIVCALTEGLNKLQDRHEDDICIEQKLNIYISKKHLAWLKKTLATVVDEINGDGNTEYEADYKIKISGNKTGDVVRLVRWYVDVSEREDREDTICNAQAYLEDRASHED